MSNYYNVKGLKVRVSDHEANDRLNGSNDVCLYINDVCGNLLSIEAQISRVCEKREMDMEDFQEVLKEFADGSYTKTHFSFKKEDEIDYNEVKIVGLSAICQAKFDKENAWIKTLASYKIDRMLDSKRAYVEVTKIHEATGISKTFIKKHFNR